MLKLDFDWDPPEVFKARKRSAIFAVCKAFGFRANRVDEQVSASGKGYHVEVQVTEVLSDEDVLFLQWCLGDDSTRCRLNYARVKAGVENWNKLFVRKASLALCKLKTETKQE